MPRGVAVQVMEGHHHRNHAIHRRQLAGGNALAHLRELADHVGTAAQAEVIAPDLAVIGTQVSEQYLKMVALIGAERAFVVVPERRTQQGGRHSGDRGNDRAALGQGLLQFLIAQRTVVGVVRRCGVKAQQVPLFMLTMHDRPALITVTRTGCAGLHEEHRLDAWLQRIVGQAVEHGDAGVVERRSTRTIVKGQQKSNRWLLLQLRGGFRGQRDRRTDAGRQACSDGQYAKSLEHELNHGRESCGRSAEAHA